MYKLLIKNGKITLENQKEKYNFDLNTNYKLGFTATVLPTSFYLIMDLYDFDPLEKELLTKLITSDEKAIMVNSLKYIYPTSKKIIEVLDKMVNLQLLDYKKTLEKVDGMSYKYSFIRFNLDKLITLIEEKDKKFEFSTSIDSTYYDLICKTIRDTYKVPYNDFTYYDWQKISLVNKDEDGINEIIKDIKESVFVINSEENKDEIINKGILGFILKKKLIR